MAAIFVSVGPAVIDDVLIVGIGDATTPAIHMDAGINMHVLNVECRDGGGILTNAGDGSSVKGCHVEDPDGYGIKVEGSTGGLVVSNNTVRGASQSASVAGLVIDGDGNGTRDVVVAGNHIESTVAGISVTDVDGLVMVGNAVRSYGIGINCSDVNGSTIAGNNIAGFDGIDIELGEHGIVLTDSSDNNISDNVITEPGVDTNNTFDGIRLAGDSNRNHVHANSVRPSQAANATRYGINISASTCDDNVVADNMLGAAADYGTGAYNDAGTGTVTTRDANGQFTW